MRGDGFSFSPSLSFRLSAGVWDMDSDRPHVKKQEEVEAGGEGGEGGEREGGYVGLPREKDKIKTHKKKRRRMRR